MTEEHQQGEAIPGMPEPEEETRKPVESVPGPSAPVSGHPSTPEPAPVVDDDDDTAPEPSTPNPADYPVDPEEAE